MNVRTTTDLTVAARTPRRTHTGAASRRPSPLVELCADLLLIAVRMRSARDLGTPEALRKLVMHYLRKLQERAREQGVSQSAVDDAVFALVALIDETVLSVAGPCRDLWLSNPIQLELYGEAVAGEEFFRRAERLAASGDAVRDTLEVYLACLALGFEGRYRLAGGDGRRLVVSRIAAIVRPPQSPAVHLGMLGGPAPLVIGQSHRLASAWIALAATLVVTVAAWVALTLTGSAATVSAIGSAAVVLR